jgi:anti-sigma B factor antagonist
MDVHVDNDGTRRAAVMRVTGEVDVVSASTLRRELALHMGSRQADLVVDLTAVTFMDSTGLSVLVRAARQLHERGGRLELVVDRARVVDLLRLTAVQRFVFVHRTVEDARRHLGEPLV